MRAVEKFLVVSCTQLRTDQDTACVECDTYELAQEWIQQWDYDPNLIYRQYRIEKRYVPSEEV
jgi:hypothetical protein